MSDNVEVVEFDRGINLHEDLMRQVDLGMEGKSGTIPFPYKGLSRVVDIAKNTNYLIVGDTGSAKSTLAQDLILETMAWYLKHKNENLKLSIIYNGMERMQYMSTARWTSRLIFLREGITFTVRQILGRERDEDGNEIRLKQHEYNMIKKYSAIMDEWQKDDTFLVYQGTQNPTALSKYIEQFAKRHGRVEAKKPGIMTKQKYYPSHPNHIVLFVTDYVGVLDPEKDETGIKKQRLDKYSSTMRKARDTYGFSPINIQQLNRAVSGSDRIKMNDLKPKLSDIADTSELARDADVVIAAFEPHRYVTESMETDMLGFNLKKLRDLEGKVYYRSLHVLKNTFDTSNLNVPMAFHPVFGILKTITKPANQMTDFDYESIRNGSYFLND